MLERFKIYYKLLFKFYIYLLIVVLVKIIMLNVNIILSKYIIVYFNIIIF